MNFCPTTVHGKGAAAVAMIGVSYAMVPIYKIFCAATGYGGAVKGAKVRESTLV